MINSDWNEIFIKNGIDKKIANILIKLKKVSY